MHWKDNANKNGWRINWVNKYLFVSSGLYSSVNSFCYKQQYDIAMIDLYDKFIHTCEVFVHDCVLHYHLEYRTIN